MSSFEWNKIAGAIFLAGLISMIIGTVSHALYRPETDIAKRGYSIDVPEEGTIQVAQAAKEEEVLDIGTLLAAANADDAAGKIRQCAACHSFDKGGSNGVGPNLWNIVGAPKAHSADFQYSKAMAAMEGNWDYEALFAFLKKPRAYVKGTKMAFAGLKKPKDIANVVAYLREHADNPPAIPAPMAPKVEAAVDEAVEEITEAADVAEEVVEEAVEEAIEEAVEDTANMPAQ